jgi:hypothetical protein
LNHIWNLDGANVVSHGVAGRAAGANWSTRGTGDFNSGGDSGILFQNSGDGGFVAWRSLAVSRKPCVAADGQDLVSR